MRITIAAHRRGSILAFLLMALIAVLALVVVFFSRASRTQLGAVPAENQTTTSIGALNDDVTTPSLSPEDEPAMHSVSPQNMPPPPPAATPDTRNLPPEG